MKKWNSNEKRLGGFSKIFKPNSDTPRVRSNAGNLIGAADLFTDDLNLLNPSAYISARVHGKCCTATSVLSRGRPTGLIATRVNSNTRGSRKTIISS